MRTGTVSYKLEDLRKGVIIPIGMVGENDFTRVIFDAEEVFKKHPDAQVTMKVQPPKGGIYPATVTREGNTVIWQVKAADVAHRGSGELQLTFTADTMVEKSYIARTDIKRSLVGNGPAPDPVQDWVDNAEEVLEDLEAAEVHQPIIGEDGYWYTWNQETEEYEKTDTKAQGADGQPGQDGAPGRDGTDATPDLITKDYADLTFPVAEGTYCYHSGMLYYAKQDIQTSEAWTAAHWQQTTVEEQQRLLLSAIEGKPDIKDSLKTGVDFDLSDNNGNVVARLADGHIKTKKFNSAIVNDWHGTDYVSHGDSITWQDGKAYVQGEHTGEIARGYQTILKEKLGIDQYTNYGQSGWPMAVVNSNGIVNTIIGVSSYSGIDLVTIACGTNDFKLNVEIGSIGQIGDTTFDDTKFYGAFRKAIEYILTSNPTIRIVLMTPLQRDNSGYDVNYTNSAGHKLIDYVDAVKAVGQMYGLPVCDMYSESGFTKKTLDTYTMDGLHPNDVGYQRMGNYLTRFIMNVGK